MMQTWRSLIFITRNNADRGEKNSNLVQILRKIVNSIKNDVLITRLDRTQWWVLFVDDLQLRINVNNRNENRNYVYSLVLLGVAAAGRSGFFS